MPSPEHPRVEPGDLGDLDDGQLRAIAIEALAAVRGEPVPPGASGATDRSRRRIAAVVQAITEAGPAQA